MSTPGFILSAAPSGAPANGASAARGGVSGPDADAPQATNGEGGFAAALDDAASAAEAARSAGTEAAPDAEREEPFAATLDAATPAADTGSMPAIAAAASEAVATAVDAAATAAGWPPPGLSSLFPDSPLFASATTPGAALASTLMTGAVTLGAASQAPSTAAFAPALTPPKSGSAAPANAANPTLAQALPRLDGGAIALPPELLGPTPRAPEAALLPAAASLLAATPMALAAQGASPGTPLAVSAMALDPISAALARQPATLRLPIADEGDASGFGALLEAVAPERLPDGAAPLSTTSTLLPKLDLAQGFPAPVPMPSPRFAEELGARLQWIAEQQGGDATLRISPEGLGPVEIRLKLDGERVDLGFSASQQDTRQALQDALPKLREMLAQQGLQLGDANVGQRQAGQAQDGEAKNERGFGEDEEGGIVINAPRANEASLVIGRGGRGVLDLYA